MVVCLLVLIKKVWHSKYSPWVNAKAWFFCFRSEIPVLAKCGPKIKILNFRWNLMPFLIRVCRSQDDVRFSVFDQKYPFKVNLVQTKNKINSLSWNLLDYCNLSMQNSVVMFNFSVFIQKYLACKIWRVHWCCSLFSFWLDLPFLGKFRQKSQNCQFRRKFGTKTNLNMHIKWRCSLFLVLDRKCFF